MRFRRLPAMTLLAGPALLLLAALSTAAAQYSDPPPPKWAPNFWLSGGLGSGSAGTSSGLIALTGSAWYANGPFVGGVRKALVTPYEYGESGNDVAVLFGLRTPPDYAAIIGTLGYSRAGHSRSVSNCAFTTCSTGNSTAPVNALAYSFQARLNVSFVGVGFEFFGSTGPGVYRFSGAAVVLQLGDLEH